MFAAASGSSIATAAAMGRLAIPEMLRFKYDPALATGTVAAAGTLGAMIPPSIGFVIFGWYTETPIGKLLIAGVIPGEEVVTFAKSLAGRNDHGKVAFGTEAGLFHQRGGIPTVVCGPGSVDQAHKPDEFVSLEQIEKCERFMEKLMDHVCER